MIAAAAFLLPLAAMLSPLALASCPHEVGQLEPWSDPGTWTSGRVPADDEEVTIDKPILLDGETSRLKRVFIQDGGRLVFDPAADLSKLVSDRITVDNGGYLEIGSADCRFDGKAEILLTEVQDDDVEGDPLFRRKFLGVKAGGSLEIHGKDKRSWSKLSQTLVPHPIIFNVGLDQPGLNGIALYEFDRSDGSLINKYDIIRSKGHLKRVLGSLQKSSTVMLLSRGGSRNGRGRSNWIFDNLDEAVDLLEGPDFLDGKAQLSIRSEWVDLFDAWICVIDRADDGTVTIDADVGQIGDGEQAKTKQIAMTINGILFEGVNRVSTSGRDSSVDIVSRTAAGYNQYTLNLVDGDYSTWEAGDKLVIASTDYDMEQAEEVTVVSVSGSAVEVEGELKFVHYGAVTEDGIDMRAEVGLLTRNVKIHAETGKDCVDDHLKVCDEIDFDHFGGHTLAIFGFKSYNIQGAELTQMGQMTVLGSYPIHFHLCQDADKEGVNPLIEGNSIHHCFSRCVTIHGTHGIHVKNNVAHDTYGHCYFLEDGGEKRTVFDGNLGMTTRSGFLTPSDKQPTTFWLTSPLVSVTNNAAAGSDTRDGVGFWYLFPTSPVAGSASLGFFRPNEAKHTAITLFDTNVAHSNGRLGLAVFRRLRDDHGILGCSTYNPRAEPLNRRSELIPAKFSHFTGYKNRVGNVRMRATTTEMTGFRLADSAVGIEFVRNMLDGYQLLNDTVIVGESENAGSGEMIKVKQNNRWARVFNDRSLPNPRRSGAAVTGVQVNCEGPLHLRNIQFKKFADNDLRKACAIKFRDDYKFGMGVASSVAGLTFGFEEGQARRICHANLKYGLDESSMMLRDKDGSLTGTVGKSVTATDPYLHEDMDCQTNDRWNMSVCTGMFARFYVFPKFEEGGATFVTQEGVMQSINSKRRVGYTVNAGSNFILNWNITMPDRFRVRATGLESGISFRLGFCLPKGAEGYPLGDFVDMSNTDKFNDASEIKEADSLQALDDDTTEGKNAFLDKENGVLYMKFMEGRTRGDDDLADCIGSNKLSMSCPFVHFRFMNLENVDLADGDCTKR